MGSMVTVTILTDHLQELKAEPESLVAAVETGMTSPAQRWLHPGVWVQRVQHRIDLSVYVVGGQWGYPRELAADTEGRGRRQLEAQLSDVTVVRRRAEHAERCLRDQLKQLPITDP